MSRTVSTAIALVLSCGVVSAEVSQTIPAAAQPLFGAYRGCVVERARSFAGSADAAEVLIKNAMTACAAEKRALNDALVAGRSAGDVAGLVASLDQQVFQAATTAVLDERAAH
jgi:hypothetical protein